MWKLPRVLPGFALGLLACASNGADGSTTTAGSSGSPSAASGGTTASTLGGSPTASGGAAVSGGSASGGASGNASAGTANASAGSSAQAGFGGTAGAAGAATSGAGGGAAACTTQGNELCDDFESGQIDPQRWKLNKPTSSATISVDTQHAHSGTHAVHIKAMPGQQTTALLSEAVTFPAPSNSFYARMFAYFSPDLPSMPGADFHTGFLFGTGKNDAGDVTAGMGMIGGDKQYLGYSIFFGPPKYEFGPWSDTRIMANQWLCIELFENGMSPSEETRKVWLDGSELTDLRSTSNGNGAPANHKPPQFTGVAFGLQEYHPIPTLSDLWLDDLRVSTAPIGCKP